MNVVSSSRTQFRNFKYVFYPINLFSAWLPSLLLLSKSKTTRCPAAHMSSTLVTLFSTWARTHVQSAHFAVDSTNNLLLSLVDHRFSRNRRAHTFSLAVFSKKGNQVFCRQKPSISLRHCRCQLLGQLRIWIRSFSALSASRKKSGASHSKILSPVEPEVTSGVACRTCLLRIALRATLPFHDPRKLILVTSQFINSHMEAELVAIRVPRFCKTWEICDLVV